MMKFTFRLLLLGIGILISITSLAQTEATVDSIDFCSVKYKVASGYKAKSKYEIQCGNCKMVWLYLNQQMLAYLPEKTISQMAEKYKEFKKQRIACYLLDKESTGYTVSFKTEEGEEMHQLIAYGEANGQPVLVQLVLDKKLENNADIPTFLRQIIRVAE